MSASENSQWLRSRLELYRSVSRRRLFRAWRLAKKGERHPDPAVDALALQWAQAVLVSQPPYPELLMDPRLGLKSFLRDLVTFGGGNDYKVALMDRTDRKHAQRILHVHGLGDL